MDVWIFVPVFLFISLNITNNPKFVFLHKITDWKKEKCDFLLLVLFPPKLISLVLSVTGRDLCH